MAKITAPLLSFDARGQIGNAQVYANWRGVAYARRYNIPANPNTAAQQETRSTFGWLNNVWRYMPALVTAPWNARASGQRFTGRNSFVKENLSVLTDESDLTNFTIAGGAKAGPVAAGMSITAGSEQLAVALTAPSLPSGWSITKAVAAAIRDQDPQSGTLFEMTAASDAADPYSVDLTGLTASQLYSVGGWFEYAKPDGSVAYGPALMDTDTPTA